MYPCGRLDWPLSSRAVQSIPRRLITAPFVFPRRNRDPLCLRRLFEALWQMIERFAPEAAAIEGAFYHKNVQHGGRAWRGARDGARPVRPGRHARLRTGASPRETGRGRLRRGGKEPGSRHGHALFALEAEPQEDDSDALALAICHLQSRSVHMALASKPI